MSDDGPVTEASASPTAATEDTRAPERTADRAGGDQSELVVALSPRQIIGGFALLAGLIIWLGRRSRRKG